MKGTLLAVCAAFVLLGGRLGGHHSHTDFFLDRDATLEGTIAAIRFQNPHVLITVRTPASTLFTAEWRGANWLLSHQELVSPSNQPISSDTLHPGDRIVIVGAPPRDAALRTLVNLKEVRRPADGWTWRCRGATPSC